MEVNKIINYTINKLFFPKVVVIDKPGVFYSETSRKYGSKVSRKRQIWHFEDVLVRIHFETVKQIGVQRTSDLYYKIGKEIGTRYMLLADAKKVPSFLLYPTIEYVAKNLRSAGMSSANRIFLNKRKDLLVFEGKDNIVCRKTSSPSYIAGIISGIASYLFGQNMEAQAKCSECPGGCKIVVNKNFQNQYIPNLRELDISDEKGIRCNSRININSSGRYSFSDLLRFKKIWLDTNGKFNIGNKVIMPVEIGMMGIIKENYSKICKEQILKNAIIQEGQKIAESLLKEDGLSSSERLKKVLGILCALGWGIPDCQKHNRDITIILLDAPITKYGFFIESYFINSLLNYIFDSEFSMESVEIVKNRIVLKFRH